MRPVYAMAGLLAALAVATLGGCRGPTQAVPPARAGPHIGEAWFAHRGSGLGLTPAQARARDAALPEEAPPEDSVFDAALAEESALLWRDLCATCHGAQGRLQGVAPMNPEPRQWGGFGARMGFLFGGDKMRAGLYRKIRDGTVDPATGRPAMPSWGPVLSREQIWGLVRHIEGF